MKTKICPICDQPISGMYCKGCRKIIRKPVERETAYFLNTRHPEFEHDCMYHAEGENRDNFDEVHRSQRVMSSSEMEAKKAEIKARMLQRKQEPKSSASSYSQTVKRLSSTNPTRNPLVAIVTAAVVAVTLFITFTMIIVFNAINDVNDIGWEVVIPEPMATEPVLETSILDAPAPWPEPDDSIELLSPAETDPATMEDWELTDDEVRELGVACNGFGHFPIVFEDAVEVLSECIRDAGYNWGMSVYSYNQFLDETTWYETVYEFTIRNKEEYAGYLNITVDTVTGEVHGMELYTKYEKGFFEVADITVKFLERMDAANILVDGTEFFETAFKAQEDDRVTVQNGLEVICEIPDDESEFYRMEIYAPGYYTVAE